MVIDDYLEVRPEAKARLESAVARGQIQVGPWYTLPDEFLVSGETLVRDLQRGIASAETHGGSMRVGYLPDSFGHAAQMPQLYRQLGFRHAAVWRGVPLAVDRVAFIWEAPDGSRILTAYMGNSYSHGVDLPTEADRLASRIADALQAIEPFGPTADVLLMNGNDHVLPQRALSAAVRGASGRLNGTRIRLARLDDYLATLPKEGWPLWRGELRSSARANVLMGTLSVRVREKQLHARATRMLERLAEPIAALSRIDVAEALDQAWTLLLQNAAHDTACGSGIDAVAEESGQRSLSALRIAGGAVDRGLAGLAGDGQVWNPSPFARQGLVEADGALIRTPMIAGCSVGSLLSSHPRVPASGRSMRLENALLACELTPDGTFSVVDRQTGTRYPASTGWSTRAMPAMNTTSRRWRPTYRRPIRCAISPASSRKRVRSAPVSRPASTMWSTVGSAETAGAGRTSRPRCRFGLCSRSRPRSRGSTSSWLSSTGRPIIGSGSIFPSPFPPQNRPRTRRSM